MIEFIKHKYREPLSMASSHPEVNPWYFSLDLYPWYFSRDLWSLFNLPSSDLDGIIQALQNLRNINREEAIKVLQSFPSHCFDEIKNRKDELVNFTGKVTYQSIYNWLWKWEMQLEKPPYKVVTFEDYKKRALVSKARYELIQGNKDNGKLPILSTGCIWLICEAAICFKEVKNSFNEEISKRSHYKLNRDKIEALNNIFREDSSLREWKDLKDYICNMDQVVNAYARKIASNNSSFDTNYFKPYIKAMTSWNKHIIGSKLQPLSSEEKWKEFF